MRRPVYVQLAGDHALKLKQVTTPFHDERIARPIQDEKEAKGVLAPIAARVLMKILFAARMARFDLLRAVQGLAARVTKWSADCDRALHRLVCYVHSTLDHRMTAFVGDKVADCKLWVFADADHAGEYDNRSTSGCFLVLVGPNTYYPLTAFSKKQTSVSMSSTESEVVAANVSLRAVGLPSSGLWMHLQNAGGIPNHMRRKNCKPEGLPRQLPMENVTTSPNKRGEFLSYISPNPRSHLFVPSVDKDCFIPIERLGMARTTIMSRKGNPLILSKITGEHGGNTQWENHGPVERCLGCMVRMMRTTGPGDPRGSHGLGIPWGGA